MTTLITAEEILALCPPPTDRAAYDAGRAHFVAHGLRGPDMETEWKRHGRIKPKPWRVAEAERVPLERDFPDRAHLWTDHWQFQSWQQGAYEAQFGVER